MELPVDNTDMLNDLNDLLLKYGTQSNIVKVLKKLTKEKKQTRSSKHGKLDEALAKALTEYGEISSTAFRAAASRAWTTAHPGVAKRPSTPYQDFMKTNLAKIREDNPGLKYTCYMGLVAKAWKEHNESTTTAATETTDVTMTAASENVASTAAVPLVGNKTRSNKK